MLFQESVRSRHTRHALRSLGGLLWARGPHVHEGCTLSGVRQGQRKNCSILVVDMGSIAISGTSRHVLRGCQPRCISECSFVWEENAVHGVFSKEIDQDSRCSTYMKLPRLYRWLSIACWLCLCVGSSGCVVLGIPSERFHDPADAGGLLGDWKRDQVYGPSEVAAELAQQGVVIATHDGVFCGDEAALDAPPNGCSGTIPARLPEVPWPRFHPVPTRPVFGTVH